MRFTTFTQKTRDYKVASVDRLKHTIFTLFPFGVAYNSQLIWQNFLDFLLTICQWIKALQWKTFSVLHYLTFTKWTTTSELYM